MITLTIIILIIVAICSASSKDKKSTKQLAEIEEATNNLPNISLKAHEITSAQRALNMWPSDSDVLDLFRYSNHTKNIYLRMKDGRYVSCPLSDLDVCFDKFQSLYRIVIKHGSTSFSFYVYAYFFTDKEWDVILNTLTLAGTTRNVAIMGNTYKNISKVNTVLKIIKALS